MNNKSILIVVLLLVLLSIVAYPRIFTAGNNAAGADTVVGVSQVTANPSDYLGKLTVHGIVNQIYEEEGFFMIADQGGCCQLPVVVPFTAEQQAELNCKYLYAGAMPAFNDRVIATGTLISEDGYFVFEIAHVEMSDKIIISKN